MVSIRGLYYPICSSGKLKLNFVVTREGQRDERDSDLCGNLNNEDIGTPLWFGQTSGYILVSHVLVVVVITCYYL